MKLNYLYGDFGSRSGDITVHPVTLVVRDGKVFVVVDSARNNPLDIKAVVTYETFAANLGSNQ